MASLRVGSYSGITDINVIKLPMTLSDAFISLMQKKPQTNEQVVDYQAPAELGQSGNLHNETASSLLNLLQNFS